MKSRPLGLPELLCYRWDSVLLCVVLHYEIGQRSHESSRRVQEKYVPGVVPRSDEPEVDGRKSSDQHKATELRKTETVAVSGGEELVRKACKAVQDSSAKLGPAQREETFPVPEI